MVFVLATTEAHKVPATIVDRCHRFDFQRPSLEQIASVLGRVAEQEDIEIPDPAGGMIARAATGSFRDALGTLEQLVTYGGKEVELDDVLEILGVADAELVLDTAEALADRDPKAALLAVQRLSDSGRDFTQFMRDLSAHLRHLFVVQTLGEVPDSFSVTAEHTDRLATQAERLSQGEIVRAIELLASGIGAIKEGSDPRIQLELALLKATQPQADLSLQALMFRIEQLERRLAGAEPAEEPAPAPQVEPPRPTPHRPSRPARPRAGGAQAQPAPRASAAPAVAEAVAEPAPTAALDIDLENVQALWPAVADAVCEQNAMVGALRGAGARHGPRGRPPHGRLPRGRRVFEEEGRGQPRARDRRPPRPHRASARGGLRAGAHAGGRAPAAQRGRADRAPARGVRRRGGLRGRRRRAGLARLSAMPKQPNMNQMMKQVQQMQAEMMKAQEQLKHEVVEASAGGGMVTVKVTGDLELQEIKIDPGAVDPEDVELLQDMVLAATNEALRSAQELAANRMGGLTGGLGDLGLPGL